MQPNAFDIQGSKDLVVVTKSRARDRWLREVLQVGLLVGELLTAYRGWPRLILICIVICSSA
jgi:hypothetical protein